MKKVELELTVLFTKKNLNFKVSNEIIKKEYLEMFGKEVSDVELNEFQNKIVEDQDDFLVEIPEDYELHKI